MTIFFWGFLLLTIAFLSHLVFWKIHLPKRQTKVLLLIFFGTWGPGLFALWFSPSYSLWGFSAPTVWTEFLQIAVVLTAFTLAYMITYSGMEADSPSLVMVLAVAEAGSEGLPKRVFNEMMTDDLLVKPRVRDLLTDRMAYLDGDLYRLTPKGQLMAKIFIVYRKLLKANKGG